MVSPSWRRLYLISDGHANAMKTHSLLLTELTVGVNGHLLHLQHLIYS